MRTRLAAAAAACLVAATSVTLGAASSGAASPAYSVDTNPQAFLKNASIGSAVLRWNPCSTIRYAVNPTGGPAGFVAEARRAVTELAHDSGLKLAYEGTTTIRPQLDNSYNLYTPPMKAAHLNLVIAWDSHSAPHSLLALQSGEAGETVRMSSGSETTLGARITVSPTQYHYAAISLDERSERSLVKYDAKGNGLYHLLLHELGHAVGLNHVTDKAQIMYPVGSPGSAVHYGNGDKAGLKAVGFDAGCL